jgi:hypothetical protein
LENKRANGSTNQILFETPFEILGQRLPRVEGQLIHLS